MDATFLKSRLANAAEKGHAFTLLLRGAHTLTIERATVTQVSDGDSDETRFEIAGLIAADGGPAGQGRAFVSSGDIAALLVRDT
jgi:hypothetical protein